MTFDQYLDQAWADHADHSARVADGFTAALAVAQTPNNLNDMIHLITHVTGDHLAQWQRGIDLLATIKQHASYVAGSDTESAIDRSTAALRLGSGDNVVVETLSVSDRIRVTAMAAAALVSHDVVRAQALFLTALKLAEGGLDAKDPANRALAVTGNNLAGALEDKTGRTEAETELMILAAKTGRKFWEIAGNWLNVARAENRLAMAYRQAKQLELALEHAKTSIELRHANSANESDLFYGYEGLAWIESERGNREGLTIALGKAADHFDRVSAADRVWCEPVWRKLQSSVG